MTESLTRKPVPRPLTLASARMSWRRPMVVVPLAPVPWPEIRLAVVMVRFATPAAEAAPVRPPTTRVPWPLAVLRVVTARVSACAASGVSSMRPPPFWTLRLARVSEVAAPALPPRTNLPPWI